MASITAASYFLLCLMSTFHIRFITINSLFSKTHFCQALAVLLITVLSSHYGIWTSPGSNHKNIDGSDITNDKCNRHISLLFHKLGFKKIQKHSLKCKVTSKFFRGWINSWSFYEGFLIHELLLLTLGKWHKSFS